MQRERDVLLKSRDSVKVKETDTQENRVRQKSEKIEAEISRERERKRQTGIEAHMQTGKDELCSMIISIVGILVMFTRFCQSGLLISPFPFLCQTCFSLSLFSTPWAEATRHSWGGRERERQRERERERERERKRERDREIERERKKERKREREREREIDRERER